MTDLETNLRGLMFDVSEANGGEPFDTLSDALNYADSVLLDNQKKGGMTIKYVQSSDNKYIQARLMADEFTTDTTQWAIAEEGVYIENPEFIYVKTDAEGRILWAIKTDGSIYYGAGVPQQVIDYVQEKITELSLDEYGDIVAFLNGLEKEDKTLQTLFNEKVDKEEGKSLINAEYAEGVSYIENPEFVGVVTDNEDRIIYAITVDGDFYFGAGVPKQIIDYVTEHIDVEELLSLIGSKVDKEEGKSLIDEGVASSQSVMEDPENRHEITLDFEDKIISYRKEDGTKVENVGFESPKVTTGSLSLSESGMTDFQKALKDSGFRPGGMGDWSDRERVEIPIPKTCAIVNFGVDGQVTTKTADVETYIEYYDCAGNYFKKPIILNAQGNSSLSYWIKNQAFDLDDGSEIKFGNWVAQDSFHVKKFYIDVFRGQSIVAYKLIEQVYQTRPYGERRPWDYLNANNSTTNGIGKFKQDFDTGAMGHSDGFPIKVYFNGTFGGVYVLSLKKHRDNYCCKKDNAKQIILDGQLGSGEIFGGTIDWTKFEIRNPKSLKTVDGGKYDGDNPTEITGDASVDAITAQVKTNIQRLSGAFAAINADRTKAKFEEYFNVPFFIDYFLTAQVLYHMDGFWKNWIWITNDGNIWAPTLWDADSIFGMFWQGTHIVPAGEHTNRNTSPQPAAWTNTNVIIACNAHVVGLLLDLYWDEVTARYGELRDKGVFTTENITGLLSQWLNHVSYDNLKADIEEVCAYEGVAQTPSYRDGEGTYIQHPTTGGFYNSVTRVKNWLDEHLAYLDSQDIFNYKN